MRIPRENAAGEARVARVRAAAVDEVAANEGEALEAAPLGTADFRPALADFWLTNPIARASALLAEMSARAKARRAEGIAAQ